MTFAACAFGRSRCSCKVPLFLHTPAQQGKRTIQFNTRERKREIQIHTHTQWWGGGNGSLLESPSALLFLIALACMLSVACAMTCRRVCRAAANNKDVAPAALQQQQRQGHRDRSGGDGGDGDGGGGGGGSPSSSFPGSSRHQGDLDEHVGGRKALAASSSSSSSSSLSLSSSARPKGSSASGRFVLLGSPAADNLQVRREIHRTRLTVPSGANAPPINPPL
jgi:hypothetical protein